MGSGNASTDPRVCFFDSSGFCANRNPCGGSDPDQQGLPHGLQGWGQRCCGCIAVTRRGAPTISGKLPSHISSPQILFRLGSFHEVSYGSLQLPKWHFCICQFLQVRTSMMQLACDIQEQNQGGSTDSTGSAMTCSKLSMDMIGRDIVPDIFFAMKIDGNPHFYKCTAGIHRPTVEPIGRG